MEWRLAVPGEVAWRGTFNLGRRDPGMAVARRPSLRGLHRRATGKINGEGCLEDPFQWTTIILWAA